MFLFFLILVSIIVTIIDAVTLLLWFITLLGQKSWPKKFWFIALSSLIAVHFLSPLIPEGYYTTVNSSCYFIILFGLACYFMRHLPKRIIALFSLLAHLIVYWPKNLYTTLFPSPSILLTNILALSTLSILSLCLVLAFRKYHLRWYSTDYLSKHQTFTMVLLCTTLGIRVLNDMIGYWFINHVFIGAIWLDIFILMLICSLICVPIICNQFWRLKLDLRNHEVTIKEINNYAQALEQTNITHHYFQHDYKNILASLECAIVARNFDDVENIYYTLIQPTKSLLKRATIQNLHFIDSASLKGLLVLKHHQATQKRINFTIEITEHINFKRFNNILDIYRPLAILMDNAIEAATASKDKTVHVIFIEYEQHIAIQVKNTYLTAPDLMRMHQSGFSTKTDHQGFGLAILQQFIEKYPFMELSSELHATPKTFQQNFTIQKNL